MKSLLLLGHFPPPRGGIATHLDRLRAALRSEGIPVHCYSFGDANAQHPDIVVIRQHPMAFMLAMIRGAALLHYHTDERDWKFAALLGMWCMVRRQRYVYTLHSFRRHAFLSNRLFRWIICVVYWRAEHIVCISENLAGELEQLLPDLEGHTIIAPSYLPVSIEERVTAIIPSIAAFATRYRYVVSFNAFEPSLVDGVDLYGADILLEAFASLALEFPEAGLIMVYMRSLDTAYGRMIRERAGELGDRVLLIDNSSESFIPILLRSHVFVRATNNDGGPSLSVLEGLTLGKWCIASDAVPRPEQCIMFRNRSAPDLLRALRLALERCTRGEVQTPVEFSTAATSLIPMYRQYL